MTTPDLHGPIAEPSPADAATSDASPIRVRSPESSAQYRHGLGAASAVRRSPPLARPITLGVLYEAATDPLPSTDCRLWSRALDSDGYGSIGVAGRTFRVPRLVLALSVGLTVDEFVEAVMPPHVVTRHRCPAGDDRRCIEADHLDLGWAALNVADAIAAGTHVSQRRREAAR